MSVIIVKVIVFLWDYILIIIRSNTIMDLYLFKRNLDFQTESTVLLKC